MRRPSTHFRKTDPVTLHRYRSHTCGALRESDIGASVRLSGWCHRIRDHGGVLFIDLRDHYGMTQVVIDPDSPAFAEAETLRSEWVVRIDGKVKARLAGHVVVLRADDLARAITFVAETPRGGFIANMELQPEAPLATTTERQQLKVDESALGASEATGKGENR